MTASPKVGGFAMQLANLPRTARVFIISPLSSVKTRNRKKGAFLGPASQRSPTFTQRSNLLCRGDNMREDDTNSTLTSVLRATYVISTQLALFGCIAAIAWVVVETKNPWCTLPLVGT